MIDHEMEKLTAWLNQLVGTIDHIDQIKERILHHVARIPKYGYSTEYFKVVSETITAFEEQLDTLEAEAEEAYRNSVT